MSKRLALVTFGFQTINNQKETERQEEEADWLGTSALSDCHGNRRPGLSCLPSVLTVHWRRP